jgi:hypothetical protein
VNCPISGCSFLYAIRWSARTQSTAHEVAKGTETEAFDVALQLEDARLEGEVDRLIRDPRYVSHSQRHHAYRMRGEYVSQLERLAALFGRDQIHVVDSGDFFAAPERVYDAVLEFLQLPRWGYPSFERHNARPRTAMPEPVRSAPDDHFLPYDARLTRWLGKDPSSRR